MHPGHTLPTKRLCGGQQHEPCRRRLNHDSSVADSRGTGRRPRSSPRPGEPVTWRRGPASRQQGCWNAGRTLVNTDALEDAAFSAERRVLEIQAKLHRWAREDSHRRFDDLFNLVADPAFLLTAWMRVRGNKGARTPGVDGNVENVRGVEGFLDGLRSQVKDRTFRPLPVRERLIPKASGKLRRLGIASVADRTVQASLKLVLEPIFEANFLPCSYGLRPMRRAHDAIAEVHYFASRPRNYEWIVEGDITACFDEIDHSALMDRVRDRIADKRVLDLVKAFLKSGILAEDGQLRASDTGTPQGSIITPPTQWVTRA
ncbi:reverse transcriptase domain-containing protein [Streptomyces sp. AS58]|uniref:reverse transcriptase domain-containing protein n=1 Tax=Streptomyces sp. AS58 TaxID=1519489 RepID=UPI002D219C0D|nr:reverse transcriptase domain-containing protein [Streptomyces sp. AS58]